MKIILGIILSILSLQAFAQSAESAYKNGQVLVKEFNRLGDKTLASRNPYDLRNVLHEKLAKFIYEKMDEGYSLVVVDKYLSMDQTVTDYYLIDSVTSKTPKTLAQLKILLTSEMEQTDLYYTMKSFFSRYPVRKVEISKNDRNSMLKEITVGWQYRVYQR